MVPRYGSIGIFNRSHYEEVLVVRVMKLKEVNWKERFRQINDFERMLTENIVVLLKFFLHVSKKEQKQRLLDRLEDPTKHWKFASSDLETRAKWDDFMDAYEDMLNHCSPPAARWHIVAADHKWYRDFLIASATVKALEKLNLKWPKLKGSMKEQQKALERK